MLLNGRSKGFDTLKNSKDNLEIQKIKEAKSIGEVEIGVGALTIEG